MAKLVVPVAIELTDKQADTVANSIEGPSSTEDKVRMVTADLVRQLANGGVMLTASAVKRIRDAGCALLNADDLIRDVEYARDRDRGNVILRFSLDPCRVGPIQAIADFKGISLNDLVQRDIEQMLNNGTFYSIPAPEPSVAFSEGDWLMLQGVLGMEVMHGSDLANWIRDKAGLTEAMPFEEPIGAKA